MTAKQIEKKLAELKTAMEEAVSRFEQDRANLMDRATEFAEKLREYHDERSEKWQESEKGGEFDEFTSAMEQWASDVDSVEVEFEELPEVTW